MNDKFTIRFATLSDIDAVMLFIEQNWKSNHILSQNKDFFCYEYVHDNEVNFVLAVNNENQELIGVCGFIKNSVSRNGANIWGALLKVKKNNNLTVALNLLEFIADNSGCNNFSTNGIARNTFAFYEFLRYETGQLQHYYMLNNSNIDFLIAKIALKPPILANSLEQYKFLVIENFGALKSNFVRKVNNSQTPYKDDWYIEKRYFGHPIYKYNVFGIISSQINSLLITREVVINNSKILRIIDFIGSIDDLNHIQNALQELMKNNQYEYIDIYCAGLSDKTLINAGFVHRRASDLNIIPNYFEPFIQKNIDLYYFTKNKDNFVIFKGDGDQDRPSTAINSH